MILSVREILDLAERCFSTAGFDPGTARANATAIWWTEVYHGTGFVTLCDLLDELDSLDDAAPDLDHRESPISTLDGRGRPCVVSALPALDLSCAHARRDGAGIAYVKHSDVAADGNVLAGVVHRAADRGYTAVALAVDDDGTSRTVVAAPGESCPVLAETGSDAPSTAYAAVEHAVQTDRHHATEAPLFRSSFDEPEASPFGTADARLLHRFLRRSTSPTDGTVDGGFIVACIDASHPRYGGAVGRVADHVIRTEDPFDRTVLPETTLARLDRFVEEGVEVDRAVWREVFEFSNGVLAPPFEGSEKGAGFDLNELEE